MRVKRIKMYSLVAWSMVNVMSVRWYCFLLVVILIYYYIDLKHRYELLVSPTFLLDFVLFFCIMEKFIHKVIDFIFGIKCLVQSLERWDSVHRCLSGKRGRSGTFIYLKTWKHHRKEIRQCTVSLRHQHLSYLASNSL